MDQATKDKVIAGLRARKGDQIRGQFYDFSRDSTKGCAVGIVAEILGYDRADFFRAGYGEGPGPYLMKRGFDLFLLKNIVSMNDAERRSFDQIADWLERKLRTHTTLRFEPYLMVPKPDWTKDAENYANAFNLTNA